MTVSTYLLLARALGKGGMLTPAGTAGDTIRGVREVTASEDARQLARAAAIELLREWKAEQDEHDRRGAELRKKRGSILLAWRGFDTEADIARQLAAGGDELKHSRQRVAQLVRQAQEDGAVPHLLLAAYLRAVNPEAADDSDGGLDGLFNGLLG